MFLWRFFRKFSLPCSLVMGALGYLIFANVPFLVPIGDYCGPRLVSLMPVVLFALLYVTFCKIEIKEMKPKTWHFILQLIRTSLALMMVVLIFEFGSDYSTKLILEGAFICFICPTAAAVAVVTEKLGGSIGSLTTYTVIANIFTMVIIPSLFPMVEKGADAELPETKMKELLSKYQLPKMMLSVGAIPLTETGKINRAACRQLALTYRTDR